MTAQPTDPDGTGMWGPDPVRQRLANHTVEDVLALPDDAPRVELRDGVPALVPPPTIDLVDGRYEPAADSAEELIVTKPFDVRLPVRDMTP